MRKLFVMALAIGLFMAFGASSVLAKGPGLRAGKDCAIGSSLGGVKDLGRDCVKADRLGKGLGSKVGEVRSRLPDVGRRLNGVRSLLPDVGGQLNGVRSGLENVPDVRSKLPGLGSLLAVKGVMQDASASGDQEGSDKEKDEECGEADTVSDEPGGKLCLYEIGNQSGGDDDCQGGLFAEGPRSGGLCLLPDDAIRAAAKGSGDGSADKGGSNGSSNGSDGGVDLGPAPVQVSQGAVDRALDKGSSAGVRSLNKGLPGVKDVRSRAQNGVRGIGSRVQDTVRNVGRNVRENRKKRRLERKLELRRLGNLSPKALLR